MIRNLLLHSQKKLGGKTIIHLNSTRRWKKTNRRLKPSSMAFWGALVRTDEPSSVVLHGGPDRRLHVSQAVLGRCRDPKTECKKSRTRLYCKVGGSPRVLLCALRFNGIEMCSLDLEFTAPDKVVFSVVGVRDIHISGYYFNEFPLPFTIMPQHKIASASNREEAEMSGAMCVLECPLGDGPQIGGQDAPMQHVGETGIDTPRPVEESVLRDGGDQHVTPVKENGSPSIDMFTRSVADDSREQLLGTGDPHQLPASGDSHNDIPNQVTNAEVTEKYGEIVYQNVEAIISRIVAEVEMGVEAESVGYNENQMTMHVECVEKSERLAEEGAVRDGADQHINLVEEIKGPSINKSLGIVTQALQQSLMNFRALGQGQPILACGWKEMQNLPELLMHMCYCLLTKVPYKMDWTSIALSYRSKDVQAINKKNASETLYMRNPRIGRLTHRVKSTRHVEKITFCELEEPGNTIKENDSDGHSDKSASHDVPDQHGKLIQENCCPRDDSQLADEDRLKPERKKRRADRNSMSVGLTSICKEASEPNQQSGAVGPRKVVECSKERSYIDKDKIARRILRRRGVDEENLQLQTDECGTTMHNYHFGKEQQVKAKKKGKAETICNQYLCNQMSQSDDGDSTRHITNEQEDKLRSGLVMDEEKLHKCDAPDAEEIKKRKKSKAEEVMVQAANTEQECDRYVSVEPAATRGSSTGIENTWTIVAALPAFSNPQIKCCSVEQTRKRLYSGKDNSKSSQRIRSAPSTDTRPKLKHDFVEADETREVPSDVRDSGKSRRKRR